MRGLKWTTRAAHLLATALPVLGILALISGVIWDAHSRARRDRLRQSIQASADGDARCRACHEAGLECVGCRAE